MRGWLIGTVAAVVALASGLAAFAQAGQKIAPQLAIEAFPLDGSAWARKAELDLSLSRARARDPLLPPTTQVVEMARQAYLREPLEPAAITVLGRAVWDQDARRGVAILRHGHALTRRSTLLNTELVTLAGKQGDVALALELIDEILRRETAAHGALLVQLSTFAGNPSLGPLLLDLIAGDAAWAPQFWRQLAQSPAGLANAANLRIEHARRGGDGDSETDRMLIEGLAGQARYDDAQRLARALFPETRSTPRPGPGEVLRNADFASRPDFLPFDWRLVSTGDFGAGMKDGGGSLLISALGGSRGVAAEQLVALPDAPLLLGATVATPNSADRERLLITLTCADSRGTTLFTGTPDALPARLSPAPCRWAWLRFSVRVPTGADGVDWTVDKVSLARARS